MGQKWPGHRLPVAPFPSQRNNLTGWQLVKGLQRMAPSFITELLHVNMESPNTLRSIGKQNQIVQMLIILNTSTL